MLEFLLFPYPVKELKSLPAHTSLSAAFLLFCRVGRGAVVKYGTGSGIQCRGEYFKSEHSALLELALGISHL